MIAWIWRRLMVIGWVCFGCQLLDGLIERGLMHVARPSPICWALMASAQTTFVLTIVRSTLALRAARKTRRYTFNNNTFSMQFGGGYIQIPVPEADPDCPDTLGWRSWLWVEGQLRSPIQGTHWTAPELRCDAWDESGVVRGRMGIHAHLVPLDWAKHVCPEGVDGMHGQFVRFNVDGSARIASCVPVDGIVERFDRYVLGESGWRAEWVIIRKLRAPTQEIGLELERAFPDVEVVYDHLTPNRIKEAA